MSGRPGEETVGGAVREPLERVLGWMLSLRDAQGRILCPDHRIEHTGKSAGAIVIACALARNGGAPGGGGGGGHDALAEAAVQQGERLVARLEREGQSTCFTFRPGRHDPYNCSNNVIDGGAAADALAELVLTFGPRLETAQRERFTHAAVLHAQTYLRYAALDKGVPAQRAWALTGLAGAFALAGHEVLELAVLEASRELAAIQHADGSYPYHPLEWGAAHPGASDVSAYYQSRVTAFLDFSLERIGRDPGTAEHGGPIERGLDFLLALQGPFGIKCGQVEAKPWYWGAEYEVASHPFDVYALARGWRRLGDERLASGAARAWRAWVDHLSPEGRPASHHGGPGRQRSYQCPLFWAAHASWAARAMGDLEAILAREERSPEDGPPEERPPVGIEVTHFPQSSLTRLEDAELVAWVRGGRPAANAHHGSPRGAGLLAVSSRRAGRVLLEPGEGTWSGRSGPFSLARGWRSGGSEVRFSVWLARNAWRGRRRREAFGWPARVLSRAVLAYGTGRVGSEFDLAPETLILDDGVRLTSRLARPDGTPIGGSFLQRTWRVTGRGLEVEEEVLDPGGVTGLDYRMPLRAEELERSAGRIRYRLG